MTMRTILLAATAAAVIAGGVAATGASHVA
jgi:hypothetical protein